MKDKLNWELNGYYNLNKFFVKDNKYKLNDYIYLDLDINGNLRNIGHHFTLFENKKGLNANIFFNKQNYREKCPLPTILILCWLMGEKEILNDINKLAFIVYCDSFLISFKKYNKNCTSWLKNMGLTNVLYELERNEKEKHIDNIILTKIIPKMNEIVGYKNISNVNINEYTLDQYVFKIRKNMNSEDYHIKDFNKHFEFIKFLNSELGFKPIYKNEFALYKLTQKYDFYSYCISYNDQLKEELLSKKVVSNAIVYKNKDFIDLKITLMKPILPTDNLYNYIKKQL